MSDKLKSSESGENYRAIIDTGKCVVNGESVKIWMAPSDRFTEAMHLTRS